MRRHPNRLSTTHVDFVEKGLKRQPVRSPKRGPKNRRRLWPTLHYIIVKDVGVVWERRLDEEERATL
jgi:hypothetical protein